MDTTNVPKMKNKPKQPEFNREKRPGVATYLAHPPHIYGTISEIMIPKGNYIFIK
jgi:hypothetical protein